VNVRLQAPNEKVCCEMATMLSYCVKMEITQIIYFSGRQHHIPVNHEASSIA